MIGLGDAYPLPRPDDVYGFDDCDEVTLCELAALDEIRRRFANRGDGSMPTGRANCALIDAYAREIVDRAQED